MKSISDTEKKEITKYYSNWSGKKPCDICGKMLSIDEAKCPIVCSPKNKICSEMVFCCKSHTFEEHIALVKQRRKLKKTLEVSLKELIEKNTKEQFDNEEINLYCILALEELCCTDIINEWVKYRVLSIANTAIGINEKNCKKKSRFLKKAEILRKKMPRLKIAENRQTAANTARGARNARH